MSRDHYHPRQHHADRKDGQLEFEQGDAMPAVSPFSDSHRHGLDLPVVFEVIDPRQRPWTGHNLFTGWRIIPQASTRADISQERL